MNYQQSHNPKVNQPFSSNDYLSKFYLGKSLDFISLRKMPRWEMSKNSDFISTNILHLLGAL